MNKKNHTKNSNSVNINSKKKYTRKLFGIINQNEYETIVPKKNEYDIKNVSNYDRISSKGINIKEVIFTGRGKISIGKPEKLKLSVDDNQDKETIDEIAEHFEKKIEDLKANYREEISHLTYTNILNSNEQKLLYEKEISNLKINSPCVEKSISNFFFQRRFFEYSNQATNSAWLRGKSHTYWVSNTFCDPT